MLQCFVAYRVLWMTELVFSRITYSLRGLHFRFLPLCLSHTGCLKDCLRITDIEPVPPFCYWIFKAVLNHNSCLLINPPSTLHMDPLHYWILCLLHGSSRGGKKAGTARGTDKWFGSFIKWGSVPPSCIKPSHRGSFCVFYLSSNLSSSTSPLVPLPDKYDGHRDCCNGFLMQCAVYLY